MSEKAIQPHERSFDHILMSASALDLLGGTAGVILAILGLVHYAPTDMAAVSCIALGAALALNGGLLATERSRVMARAHATTLEAAQFTGGVSLEAAAGLAAVVLGILTLLKIDATALMPVAALVLGVGTIFSSGVLARVNSAASAKAEDASADRSASGEAAFPIAFHVLVGLSAIVLSILALIGFVPLLLSLVAFLAIGVALILSGASVTNRMLDRSRPA